MNPFYLEVTMSFSSNIIFFGVLFLLCVSNTSSELNTDYYLSTCPDVHQISASVVRKFVSQDPRMAASLIRLQFHDCFVQGCDASILLDYSKTSEKNSRPNNNSIRGFDVIDEIKSRLEEKCPKTVSCADIITLAARDSVVLSGGPTFDVSLGRNDSLTANLTASNEDLPGTFFDFTKLLTFFERKGLNMVDLVALSGAHTIGLAKCNFLITRLYNNSTSSFDPPFATLLKQKCPPIISKNEVSLDFTTPNTLDNLYYRNLLASKGLLVSDQSLLNLTASKDLVEKFAMDNSLFLQQFTKSMIKLGNIAPSIGSTGEVRTNCRKIN